MNISSVSNTNFNASIHLSCVNKIDKNGLKISANGLKINPEDVKEISDIQPNTCSFLSELGLRIYNLRMLNSFASSIEKNFENVSKVVLNNNEEYQINLSKDAFEQLCQQAMTSKCDIYV